MLSGAGQRTRILPVSQGFAGGEGGRGAMVNKKGQMSSVRGCRAYSREAPITSLTRTEAFCGAAWRRPGVQVVEEEEGLECERSEVQSGNPEQPTCQHVPPNNDKKDHPDRSAERMGRWVGVVGFKHLHSIRAIYDGRN